MQSALMPIARRQKKNDNKSLFFQNLIGIVALDVNCRSKELPLK
tara:strand:- start:415 stop:546 length:132 start_codon:yes stop_codon:yes gene_type:complete